MATPMNLPVQTHLVSAPGTPGFSLLEAWLRQSAIVALDAEWQPLRSDRHAAPEPSSTPPAFPTVTVLQIACRSRSHGMVEGCVFVVDLVSVPAAALWEMLREVFAAPNVVKLGFRFKQDLVYLSSTFSEQGCYPGFDRVIPFLDITTLYHHIRNSGSVKKNSKETKSLAMICKELLDISLSKELQCSDWACRPLTEEQISYAAADAYYLLEIFDVFQSKFTDAGVPTSSIADWYYLKASLGLKGIFEKSNPSERILSFKFCKASEMIKSNGSEFLSIKSSTFTTLPPYINGLPLENSLLKILEIFGEPILLKESDKKPRATRKKRRKPYPVNPKNSESNGISSNWEGLPPWDPSLGGDGCPKFLCDVMVEGLAKHLRCVGFDAAVPSCRKPEPRLLINQSHKEKRVLLTRDVKLLKYQYLTGNHVYKVKSLLKNDQLLEVIEIFQLKICEDQLMSRCTKCNGRFIQKPLSIEEAVAASKGFQIIPDCLFNKDLEFWQCLDCNQLYWEGTQYHNAVQKFINVCKLNE